MANMYNEFYGCESNCQVVNRLKDRVEKLEQQNKEFRNQLKEIKIYIVTGGCVTDYHNVKIFNDKKMAEEFAENYKHKNPCEDVDIEEYVWKETGYKKVEDVK